MYILIYVFICIYIYMYVYPDALRANPPPRFLKKFANLFEVWGTEPCPGTRGKMRARSTVLHGERLGSLEPPYGM